MATGQSAAAIFGPRASDFLVVPRSILAEISSVRVSYDFVPPDQFRGLLESDWPAAQRIYWSELIARAHLTAVSSVLRSTQWIDGALLSNERDLLALLKSEWVMRRGD